VFRIVQHRYWFFGLSLLVLVPGILALAIHGLPASIDFTGGAVFEVQFDEPDAANPVTEEGIRAVYAAEGVVDVQVVEAAGPEGSNLKRYQIKSPDLTQDQKTAITDGLTTTYGALTVLKFDTTGPSVGAQVSRSGTIAVIMASLGILLYLTIQFRTVPHPIRYGICAILAMLHDVGVVVGLASIMGWLYGWEVDALFLTALLTVIGFSVHDSIVVFDRIRENVGRMRGIPYEDVVNHSVIQTLDRSINTQLTGIFTLFAIYIYSQGQIQRFIFWLIIGILSGTYSSIFNASPLLVVWENREWRRWFRRGEPAVA
jgi:preprotein translocase subunit SecF